MFQVTDLAAARIRALAAGALVFIAAGCVVAVGAVAAGGGIYYTKRGAETTIAAPIRRVFLASQQAFAETGVRQTEAELEHEDGEEGEREGKIEGKRRDIKVTVNLQARPGGLTRVRVTAKRDAFGWDRDLARATLERIVVLAR